MSYPRGASVNSGIPHDVSQVSYDTIDDVVRLVLKNGPRALMSKTDIEDAFRIIPIHPDDYHLLGFSWDGRFFYGRCLPMGASRSCNIFESFSKALVWILRNKFNVRDVSHILDDFFFVGPKDSNDCHNALSQFLYLCDKIGVPIKASKTVTPTNVITIYGIEVDTVLMECRLPLPKITKTVTKITEFLNRKKVTLRDMQSMVGLLNYACSVVVPGRAFLRRMINLLSLAKHPSHFIRLTHGVKDDLRIWLTFLESFNGKALILPEKWLNSWTLRLFSDAAASFGCTAVFCDRWFYIDWGSDFVGFSIAVLELFPIVIALEIWGHELANRRILFRCDNSAVVAVINKKSAKDKTLMRLIRRLVLICLQYNIQFRAMHIPGVDNVLADLLSRKKFTAALESFPSISPNPIHVPSYHIYI
ncbi:uncharacterized protein [Antedon mediterranea]|uniref:uncharacterized protein n=1 Tax=Antedon mediterranea TaxID=105859 RepID=UPI003AF57B58